jgi:hypothetical protein
VVLTTKGSGAYYYQEPTAKVKPMQQKYYVEDPATKAVLPCNWVQYEQLKAMGYVHRVATETIAVLHKLPKKSKK